MAGVKAWLESAPGLPNIFASAGSRWPIFDKVLSPVASDPMAIAGIVAGVTAFLMAIASTLLKRIHTSKAVVEALQAAGVAMEKAADSPAKSLQFPAVAEIKEPKP